MFTISYHSEKSAPKQLVTVVFLRNVALQLLQRYAKRRRSLFCALALLLSLAAPPALADITFEPYVGYGQADMQVGDGVITESESNGYLLGLRLGFDFSKSLYAAIDFCRGGPYTLPFLENYMTNASDKLVLTTFSSGIGVGFNTNSLRLWFGYYPSHSMYENLLSASFKGSMTRIGVGIVVSRKFAVHFFHDKQTLVADNLSPTNRALFCNGTDSGACIEEVTKPTTFIAFSSWVD